MHDPLVEPGELLFSYGTLQLEPVQLATFGRRLEGSEDYLLGYRSEWLEIDDSAVIKSSGLSRHPIIALTGWSWDLVRGTVYRVTTEELRRADAYETAEYTRASVTLVSGKAAWVYVDARQQEPGARRATHGPLQPKEGS